LSIGSFLPGGLCAGAVNNTVLPPPGIADSLVGAKICGYVKSRSDDRYYTRAEQLPSGTIAAPINAAVARIQLGAVQRQLDAVSSSSMRFAKRSMPPLAVWSQVQNGLANAFLSKVVTRRHVPPSMGLKFNF